MSTLLANVLGGSLVDAVKGFIDEFHASPAEKAQIQAAIDANKTVIDAKQIELQEKLEDSYQHELDDASANIRAEAATGDKYTSRARPSFIYVMLFILAANYVLFPLIGKGALDFPEALFWLFGSCMLGYTGARTWEKMSATQAK